MRAFGGGENGGGHQRLHVCGLKPRDPRRFLLAGDNNTLEMGPAFLWDWQSDECARARGPRAASLAESEESEEARAPALRYEEIAGGVTLNCHDVQWSHADAGGPAGGGALWTPSISGKGFALVSAATGELLSHYEVRRARGRERLSPPLFLFSGRARALASVLTRAGTRARALVAPGPRRCPRPAT